MNSKLCVLDCKISMGYGNKSIQKAFGDLIYGEEDPKIHLKDLLDELNIKGNYKQLNDRVT